MAGRILLIDGSMEGPGSLAQSVVRQKGVPGRIADVLLGDFDRARAQATVDILKRNLPVNQISIVRSGCEALDFLRQRWLKHDPERPDRPVLALLDEDLSGMAGHSILRSMLILPSRAERVIVLLVGCGRIIMHRQWIPEADGYLEKPFSFRKLVTSLQSFGALPHIPRVSFFEAPA